jgi:hypothetical protein
MKLSRDSILWTLGMIGGILGVAAANVGMFPEKWRGYIIGAASLIAVISGKLATSPLPGAASK